jgi:hypothetical protein
LLPSPTGRRLGRRSTDFIPDDAPQLIHRNSDSFATVVSAAYIVGNYPWSNDPIPKVLYTFPPSDPLAASYAPFLLPDGCSYSSQHFSRPADLFQYLYDPMSTATGSFFILYFPEDPSAPYIFSYRFRVSPLTLPTISHDFSLSDLLSHMSATDAPTTEICFAIKTKFPFFDLFANFIRWMLESEMVARMEVADLVERGLAAPVASAWPADVRDRLSREMCAFGAVSPPAPNGEILIDTPPSQIFRWRRPPVKRNHYPLAELVLADVVRHLNQRCFTHLFSALLLEKTIIVYHSNETVVNHVVMALHFILRPLRWASGSVSILPAQLMDLLSAPNPLLVGVTHPLVELQPWFVYFDLVAQDVRVLDRGLLPVPCYVDMERALKPVWAKRGEDCIQIVEFTNAVVQRFLEPVGQSIMSELGDGGEVRSKFCHEMFLPRFPKEERAFVEALCATQMFQMQVEQDCRRRSDSLAQNR